MTRVKMSEDITAHDKTDEESDGDEEEGPPFCRIK
jgi:hypothetical protein